MLSGKIFFVTGDGVLFRYIFIVNRVVASL